MREGAEHLQSTRPALRRLRPAGSAIAASALLAVLGLTAMLASSAPASPTAPGARIAHTPGICGGPNSAKVPCRFGTPSGNIRCIWTPKPNRVACVLRRTGLAYRLRPTGRARRIVLALARHGQTLPLNQQLVFPDSMSCRDTRRTMICNQDFLDGAFTLAPSGSHSS